MILDTLNLKEVEILSRKPDKTAGFKVVEIDSIARSGFLTKNLSELISSATPIFVKSYGQGSLATTSFRGASATHTQVLWNGININSPMPGQSDFSQIPVYFVDQVKLYYGAGSVFQTGGGLGGSLSLENQVSWSNLLNIGLLQEIASFNTYRNFASVKTGNERFQSSTRLMYVSSLNNFTYRNNAVNRENPPELHRKDAAYDQKAILQELALKTGKCGLVTARIWGQDNNREIPSNIQVNAPEGNEKMRVSFVRGLIRFDYFSGQSTFSAQTGVLYDFLNYQNKTSYVDAGNTVVSSVNKVSFGNNFSANFSISVSIGVDHHFVNSENYPGRKNRNEGSFYIGANYNLKSRLFLSLLSRQELIDGLLVPFIPSLGIGYKLLKNENLSIKFNIARNFHAPTLNDLYWYPGGNPDLKNETGSTVESGVEFKKQVGNLILEMSVTAFSSDIRDWIMWLPDSVYSYWTPSNLKNVISRGVETGVKLSGKYRKLSWNYTFGYAYTSAQNKIAFSPNDQSAGKQLIYVPENSFNQTLNVNIESFKVGYSMNFTGIRYTTSDNLRYMPAFLMQDLKFGKRIIFGKSIFDIQFSVYNLLGVNYQIVAWQPMPGRNFSFSVCYNFKN